jgi:hypothetical protein
MPGPAPGMFFLRRDTIFRSREFRFTALKAACKGFCAPILERDAPRLAW